MLEKPKRSKNTPPHIPKSTTTEPTGYVYYKYSSHVFQVYLRKYSSHIFQVYLLLPFSISHYVELGYGCLIDFKI